MRIRFSDAYADLGAAQKPPAGVSYYSRWVNRPCGRVLAAGAAALAMRPNQVTGASFVATAGALAVLVSLRPSLGSGVAVAALLALGFALDAADGQLSRLQGSGSASGEWLDHVLDAAKHVGLHAGVLVAAYRYFPVPTPWLLVPIVFQLVAVVTYAGGVLRDTIGRAHDVPRPTRSHPGRWSALALVPADSGTIALVFVTLGSTQLFEVLYSFLLAANALVAVLLLLKWWRELRAGAPV